MKTVIILMVIAFQTVTCFAQKDSVVLMGELTSKKGEIVFSIEKENFRPIRNKQQNKCVLLKDISDMVLNIDDLASLVKQRIKKDQIKDDFYQRYFGHYFNLFVFVKESEDRGKLYEVEWILRITYPEMD